MFTMEDLHAIFKVSPNNAHTPWDIWTFWISNVMMIIMIFISTIWTIKIFQKSKYAWVKFMYVLCVLQNYVTLYLSFGDYFEESNKHEQEPTVVAWTISSAVFLFFFFTIIIYWLFGFKYWVIAIEVPRFLKGSEETGIGEQ
jgi:hypothetical protein